MKRQMAAGTYAILGVCTIISACNQSKVKAAEQRAAAAEARLTQMNAIAAEKDTLMNEVIATTTFINQINDELAKVKPAKGEKTVTYNERVMPVAEFRATMLTRLKAVTKRLDDAEARLDASQARLRAMSTKDKETTAKLAAFDSMVTQYRQVMEDQRGQIAVLTEQVDTLQAEKGRLVLEKAALDTQVTTLTNVANTVYYVAGKKDDLVKRGVITEVGGARVLGIFGKAGKTLVPARQLPDSLFTLLDKRTTLEIVLPNEAKPYSIVTPNNTQFIEPRPDKDGKIHGGKFTITNPDAFWAGSKYLIVVER